MYHHTKIRKVSNFQSFTNSHGVAVSEKPHQAVPNKSFVNPESDLHLLSCQMSIPVAVVEVEDDTPLKLPQLSIELWNTFLRELTEKYQYEHEHGLNILTPSVFRPIRPEIASLSRLSSLRTTDTRMEQSTDTRAIANRGETIVYDEREVISISSDEEEENESGLCTDMISASSQGRRRRSVEIDDNIASTSTGVRRIPTNNAENRSSGNIEVSIQVVALEVDHSDHYVDDNCEKSEHIKVDINVPTKQSEVVLDYKTKIAATDKVGDHVHSECDPDVIKHVVDLDDKQPDATIGNSHSGHVNNLIQTIRTDGFNRTEIQSAEMEASEKVVNTNLAQEGRNNMHDIEIGFEKCYQQSANTRDTLKLRSNSNRASDVILSPSCERDTTVGSEDLLSPSEPENTQYDQHLRSKTVNTNCTMYKEVPAPKNTYQDIKNNSYKLIFHRIFQLFDTEKWIPVAMQDITLKTLLGDPNETEFPDCNMKEFIRAIKTFQDTESIDDVNHLWTNVKVWLSGMKPPCGTSVYTKYYKKLNWYLTELMAYYINFEVENAIQKKYNCKLKAQRLLNIVSAILNDDVKLRILTMLRADFSDKAIPFVDDIFRKFLTHPNVRLENNDYGIYRLKILCFQKWMHHSKKNREDIIEIATREGSAYLPQLIPKNDEDPFYQVDHKVQVVEDFDKQGTRNLLKNLINAEELKTIIDKYLQVYEAKLSDDSVHSVVRRQDMEDCLTSDIHTNSKFSSSFQQSNSDFAHDKIDQDYLKESCSNALSFYIFLS